MRYCVSGCSLCPHALFLQARSRLLVVSGPRQISSLVRVHNAHLSRWQWPMSYKLLLCQQRCSSSLLCTTTLTQQKFGTTMVEVETESGELIPLSVLIVPSISAPIQNSISTSVCSMPHLRGLKLAQPVTSEVIFVISLLIGLKLCSGPHCERSGSHCSTTQTRVLAV